MSQVVQKFIQKVDEQYKTGHAREMAYRPALQELFEQITGFQLINDPKRSEYGAPDFIFLNKNIVTAYAEAKDINISLEEIEKSDQMIRYFGYSNIILTNCLEFRFYKNGQQYAQPIIIAKLENGAVEAEGSNFNLLEDTIKDFIKEAKEPIKSGVHLAKVMAGKARRIRDNINIFLADKEDSRNENLLSIYEIIKKQLLADLDIKKFADMYAQTVVYGLFVARYYDTTLDTFSRQEARDLVPASNPFLLHFFDHIAGPSFDPRIEFIVNELCEEFNHADVQAIVHNYYKLEKDSSRDPIVHFYEDFLQEYDSVERKKMGVFYTPLPVVRFIVRAIDDILKKEFNLPAGLADTTKFEKEIAVQAEDARRKDGIKKVKIPFHKVQILDPATGTGTFLNETILHIYKSFVGQEGRWKNYVNEDLLPRLHGFELMMASYTIAHLKLSSTIKETGADLHDKKRIGVYLTNSLEKGEKEDQTLFSGLGLDKAISEESRQASKIKNEMPIMVILGNPPYSISSQNKGDYIIDLIKEYKKNLNERKINLDDDYIKFIRFSEAIIEKNGEGIIGMITNNSFIDGITHRQMRKHLLETFDSIYILNLHGDSKKKEQAPDGGKDENVFNIMQGVSISLFVKTDKKKKGLAEVYHTEFFGKQKEKFENLNKDSLKNIKWHKLDYKEPYYFFVPKDFGVETEYNKGFALDMLMNVNSSGIETQNDFVNIFFNQKNAENIYNDFINNNENELKSKYSLKDGRDWKVKTAKDDLAKNKIILNKIQYRPFDVRFMNYTGQTKGCMAYPRFDVIKNFSSHNLGLIFKRGLSEEKSAPIFVSNKPIDRRGWSRAGMLGAEVIAPLYLYFNDTKTSNLKKEIVAEIEKVVGKTEPEDILDYIYAVLHSPSYREKYKEFLKIDFPRVPYPQDKEKFRQLVALGKELRELHLLESPKLKSFITTYPEAGSDTVEKKYPKYKDNKVFINETQYFGNVPEIAWNFYIGGYQPAQKWLKDRQVRKLSNSDIEHYQKIIIALTETDRIMKEIDKVWK